MEVENIKCKRVEVLEKGWFIRGSGQGVVHYVCLAMVWGPGNSPQEENTFINIFNVTLKT